MDAGWEIRLSTPPRLSAKLITRMRSSMALAAAKLPSSIEIMEPNPEAWRFGPPYPTLKPAAQAHADASKKATAEGKVYRDDIGQCWPAGMPLIMTRVWPIAMVQMPTVIYMTSAFMNSANGSVMNMP